MSIFNSSLIHIAFSLRLDDAQIFKLSRYRLAVSDTAFVGYQAGLFCFIRLRKRPANVLPSCVGGESNVFATDTMAWNLR